MELKEAQLTNKFEPYTAGYILPDGSFYVMDTYHGEDDDKNAKAGYPEYSSTHFEEDTCVRIYDEPNEIQYRKLEEVIDCFLDEIGYCKVELWDKNTKQYYFYKVYSLYYGACQSSYYEEQIGNWTGYKLVQIIKNNIRNNAQKESLTESSRNQLLSKSKKDGGLRWKRKDACKVANTVKDYNKIDMDTFWKKDILNFKVRVEGETDTYLVTIEFSNILPRIQKEIQRNKNKLEIKCIYNALFQALNSSDVKIDCSCPDFKFRFAYWLSQHNDKAGEKETRESKLTNPNDNKGAACKHILAVLNNVDWLQKIASVINNYIAYCKDNMEYNYSRFIFPKVYGMDYKKAVQMTTADYDDNGETKDTLESDENIINLSNALGKVRGRFKKGENKNPVTKERKEESLTESYKLDETFDNPAHVAEHFRKHCEAANSSDREGILFTTKEVPNQNAYLQFAEWFAKQGALTTPRPTSGIIFTGSVMVNTEKTKFSNGQPCTNYLKYCETNQIVNMKGKKVPVYLYVVYFYPNNDTKAEPIIRTFFKCDEYAISSKSARSNGINLKQFKRK